MPAEPHGSAQRHNHPRERTGYQRRDQEDPPPRPPALSPCDRSGNQEDDRGGESPSSRMLTLGNEREVDAQDDYQDGGIDEA